MTNFVNSREGIFHMDRTYAGITLYGFAIGPGSDANGGGVALDGGQTHPGCNAAIGNQCFNMPKR